MKTLKRVTQVLMTASCLALAASVAQAEDCKNPDQLVFSIIPTEETTQELGIYKPLLAALKEKTGKNIEFFMPTSYASVIEGMVNGWVHIGVHGPNSYVLAKEKDPKLEVFATYTKVKGHFQEEGPGYRAVLVSRSDSKFDTIELDGVKCLRNKRMAEEWDAAWKEYAGKSRTDTAIDSS